MADEIRQLATDFGVRPYRVFLVRLRWTGTERGAGQAEEVLRREILPTPFVEDLSQTRRRASEAGMLEDGGTRISRISLTFTEDELLGRDPAGAEPAENEEFFYEVVEDGGETKPPRRRRYITNGVPLCDRMNVQWIVSVTRQQYEMGRDGQPEFPLPE